MVSHPNRGKPKTKSNPTAKDIRTMRERYGLSVEAAAALIFVSPIIWRAWEDALSGRRMHPAFWELFERKARELPPPVAIP